MKEKVLDSSYGDLPQKRKETWLIGEEAYAATLLGEGVIVDKLG